jgi:hypothetical protein
MPDQKSADTQLFEACLGWLYVYRDSYAKPPLKKSVEKTIRRVEARIKDEERSK